MGGDEKFHLTFSPKYAFSNHVKNHQLK